MCPDERNGTTVDMPRSYLSTEPAELRAQEVNFDTVLQFRSRMLTRKNGHEPDKAEIIVSEEHFQPIHDRIKKSL